MADQKISAMTAVTAPASTDVVPIISSSVNKKVTIANLVANSAPTTLVIGAGSAITSSGAGGALGTAAFTPATAYATSTQGTTADNAMPKAGGTFTGDVTHSGASIILS